MADGLPEGFVIDEPRSAGLPEGFVIDKPERGVLERAGQAMEETGSGAMRAMDRAFLPPTKEEARKYLGPSGMLRSFKETGEALLAPITGTIGAGLSGAESLAASALGPAQRGLDYAVAKGVGAVAPETGQRLEARIPSSEATYEAARPYVGAAAGALRAAPPSVPPAMPTRGPLGVTLTEGEVTGNLPAIKREQAAARAQAGEPAFEHAQAFREQRAQELGEAKRYIATEFDPAGQEIAKTPQQAGEVVSGGVRGAHDITKSGVRAAYKAAQEMGGEIHVGAFEGMPQRIKGDLTLGDDPVIIDNRITPAASSMIDYLDAQVGNLKIQNKADPFGPPRMDDPDLRGVSLKGVDQWRKNLGAIRKGAATREDRRAAGRVMDAFDDRVDRAVNGGLYTGDPDAVRAWNAARAAHADYRATFTERGRDPVGRVVEKILGRGLEDPATPNDVMSFITGSSGVSPNSLNVQVAKRLKKILGEQSPEWIAAKQGIWRKLVERPEDMKDFGSGVIGNRLGEFFNGKGKALAEEVYSTQERELARSYLDMMRKIEVPQAGANWSNNADKIVEGTAKVIKYLGTAIGGYLGHTLGAGIFGAEAAGAAIGYGAGRLAQRVQSTANLRRIRRQMPIFTQQIQQWQRAMAKGLNPSEAGLIQDLTAQLNQPSLPPAGFDEKKQGMKSGGSVKVGKASVQYGKGMPSSHCGICKYYIAGGKCQRVEGQIRPQDWCKLFEKAASRVGRLQAGGVAMSGGVPVGPDGLPIATEEPPVPEPTPLDPSLNVLAGLSPSGFELNPNMAITGGNVVGMTQAQADALGTGDLIARPYNNAEVVQKVRADPIGMADVFPSATGLGDPRVDAWYAENYHGEEGPGAMALMGRMFQEIPDAGRGTLLGGIGTLASNPDNKFTAGESDPSTNNWRLLPPIYQQPGYIARNGYVLDINSENYRQGWPKDFQPPYPGPITGVYSPHVGPYEGFPASYGIGGIHYGWPGALWGWRSYPFVLTKRGGLVP